jgi:hypothetical protein
LTEFFDAPDEHFHPHSEGGFVEVEAGVVVGVSQAAIAICGSQEEVTPRHFLQEK